MIMDLAPELEVSNWLNTSVPLSLKALHGRVVVVEAFQMLCPGCVSHSLPQAKRVYNYFKPSQVAVIGLHTVFEHHEAQGTLVALQAFLHENRISFPVAIDQASQTSAMPVTMSKYRMQGTPTLLLIDAHGRLRRQFFGAEQDLVLGAEIRELVDELPTA
jgi:peroxiredoxin